MEKPIRKQLDSTSNHEIFIDYSKSKPKIKFVNVQKNLTSYSSVALFFSSMKLHLELCVIIVLIFPFYFFNIFDLGLTLGAIFTFFYIIFIYPKLFCYIFSKTPTFMRKLPEWTFNKELFKERRYFFKEDIDKKTMTCEIPSFKNVGLDYAATDDFASKLERVEIRQYSYRKKTIADIIFFKKNKVSKFIRNPYEFKATFYFKEIPKKGWLEVIYV